MSLVLLVFAPLGLLVAMAFCHSIGRRIGESLRDGTRAGQSEAHAAVAGLVALLLAFAVNGAGTRFDARRRLIVDEANAIGTAYLRLDLVPSPAREELQQRFRAYTDSRIAAFEKLPDIAAALAEVARGDALLHDIWSKTIAVTDASHPHEAYLLINAVNEVINMATTRRFVTAMHPPVVVFLMLAVALLMSALYTGYSTAGARRSWMHIGGVALLNVLVFWVVLDLEVPRAGFLREVQFDQALIGVRASMK